jgi:glutaredoxin
MQDKVKVVMYTKPGCGLCEKMKGEMKNAGIENLYSLEEFNIETDAELFARYRYEIPVLLINGVEAFRHRLSADEFRTQVTSLLRTD